MRVQVTSGKESKSNTETGDSGRGEDEQGQASSGDPEEWIKAEEAALKAIEAQIAERRKSVCPFENLLTRTDSRHRNVRHHRQQLHLPELRADMQLPGLRHLCCHNCGKG